jgi:hypothetical protein
MYRILVVTLAAATLVAAGAFALQQRRLDELRSERERMSRSVPKSEPESDLVLSTPRAPSTASALDLTPDEKIELMQLRDRVSTLRERQRALAAVSNVHSDLRVQWIAASNLASGRLPADYIRREQARFLGGGTPEAVIESFLWAIQHRDTNALAAILEPRSWARIQSDFQQRDPNVFFQSVEAMPGMRIAGSKALSDEYVELKIEVVPGQEPMPIHLRRIDGTWRIQML